MTHLVVGMYAAPDAHEEFMKEINLWRYKTEGKHSKGTSAPYVSELKLYDIRLPEDIVDKFLNDIHASKISDLTDHIQYLQTNKLSKFFFWIVNKVIKKLGISSNHKNTDDKLFKFKTNTWKNFYLMAKLKDDQCDNVLTKEAREVL